MSSSSDGEEFYDAQDVTPARQNQANPVEKTDQVPQYEGPEEKKEDDIYDEEERKLREEMREIEEKRLREEAEVMQKLEELKIKKQQQKEKLEAEKRASENSERRNRLLEMRNNMSDDSTPYRPPPKREDGEGDENEGSTTVHDDVTQILDAAFESTNSVDDSNAAEVLTIGGSDNDRNININTLDRSKSPAKFIPQVPAVNIDNILASEDTGSDRHQDESAISDIRQHGQEPDIIVDVKNSSLGRDVVPIPVAPPRKKKKNHDCLEKAPSNDDNEVESLEVPSSPGLPISPLDVRNNAVLNLLGEQPLSRSMSSKNLDINILREGTVVIASPDQASTKAVDDNEPPKDAEIEPGQAKGQKSDPEPRQCLKLQKIEAEGDVKLVQDFGDNNIELHGSQEDGMELRLKAGFRPRSNSGNRDLTDQEILDRVSVLNLDTGESHPLSLAETKLPRCMNPLSLHIMRRTKEYSSDSSLHKEAQSEDDSSTVSGEANKTLKTVKPKKRRRKIAKLIGKTMQRIRTKKDEVLHGGESSSDDDEIGDGRRLIKIKAAHSHKGPYDFDLLVPIQDINSGHNGAVWAMKFSHCGRLLATCGQDNLLRVWVLKDSYSYFDDMRVKYSEASKKVSPAPSQDSISSQNEAHSDTSSQNEAKAEEEDGDWFAPFKKRPFCIYKGHTADLLDVSWSKNYFILSSSMDKTVRLWHISRKECLCCFQHIDFVTAITFHPKDDRYFLSGSLDGKIRLWSIPDKKVALWNEVNGNSKLITAASFCVNGRFAVVGTYDGRCIFFTTEQMKYYTQIHVRSTRGKNARGRKITGIEPHPKEDKILVTSNDSRIRLYDLRDLTLTCKYKGCNNNSSQIKASFSHDGRYIVCGSEDHFVYIWRTQHEFYKFSSARRDRSDYWEGIKAHMAVVTNAIFAPVPSHIIKPQFEFVDSDDRTTTPEVRGEVLISADYSGAIKIFLNKFKPGSG